MGRALESQFFFAGKQLKSKVLPLIRPPATFSRREKAYSLVPSPFGRGWSPDV